jgi:hypothetical protein
MIEKRRKEEQRRRKMQKNLEAKCYGSNTISNSK